MGLLDKVGTKGNQRKHTPEQERVLALRRVEQYPPLDMTPHRLKGAEIKLRDVQLLATVKQGKGKVIKEL